MITIHPIVSLLAGENRQSDFYVALRVLERARELMVLEDQDRFINNDDCDGVRMHSPSSIPTAVQPL